jgi:trehalose-phosphatase
VQAEFNGLSAIDGLSFGVVSGRRLDDVRVRVGTEPEFLAGLHGLEITAPDDRFRHAALEHVAPVLAKLAEDARRQLAWCEGCLLEDKTYALTCHVRLVPPDQRERALEEFEALAEPLLEAGALRLLTGARAMELLPAVDWNKGSAVNWIRAHLIPRVDRPVSVVYLGDDRTDEDAFSALADDDIAIGVGERPHTHLIDCRLAGPASVGRFFGGLRRVTTGGDG